MTLTRVTLATASSVLLLATLAACGDSSDGSAAVTDQSTAQAGQQPQGGPGAGGFPGASGLVAAVSGKTAQVQNAQSGQVAVSWTSGTTFTQEVDASLSDVKVGSCVMVTSADDSGSATTEQATEVDAATVRIVAASDDGSCDLGGLGGRGGGLPGSGEMPSGAPSDLPSDLPSDMPSDMPTDGSPGGGRPGGGFGGAFGEVTAVSGDGFTVSSTTPAAGSDASADPVEVTVTVSGDTTYTTTGDATAAAVKTGVCVTAQGDTDDTGALTATSISVTQAVDGECSGGFRGGVPGGAS